MSKVQLADLFVVACLATLTVAFTAELTRDLFQTTDMQTAPTPKLKTVNLRQSNAGEGAGTIRKIRTVGPPAVVKDSLTTRWLPAEISTYHPRYHGRRTASGSVYDHWDGLTAAVSVKDLRTAPLGSVWEVRYRGRTITVRITDTGSYRSRSALWLDLSGRAWQELTNAEPSRFPATARRIR